ncbi:DUF4145 domain-containing protein [Agrobacterium tumefaciens]|uniref:DUF4145 domain-containing protein n=1 Tax=Agrobacterium tumefaciens TaxID=358 RepID=UPI00080F935F|nr:DUF4145 domain-containing protein [Agrobacterium tumefaciens]NSL22830.1 DUF4145 domain-containing protein [Agrobacterium tumefaciens]NTC56783.1 DUF4145 domain-containing protein [Agrobacterium tumefaciens]NTC62563.1 DUF4145 domain-containing protein [Agrobacterium tumefaciens]NTC66293.1 DUF4145 domain-containing protein [Agrobacterium tumefaciens]NTC74873.1 DUF4145 domain-containing protein [Agrobacterium tumefaciens]
MQEEVKTIVAQHGMTWLEFFASLFASLVSLAWPVAIVLSVWIFRAELKRILPQLRLKHNETEISFRLDSAERTADTLPQPPSSAAQPTVEELSSFASLAKQSPRSALVEMRREVEELLFTQAKRSGITVAGRITTRQLLRHLRKSNVIGPQAGRLLDDILAIGNSAAHASDVEFTFEDAMRYRDIVDRVKYLVEFPEEDPLTSTATS